MTRLRFTTFDQTVVSVLGALLVAIVAVITLGDRVGVRVTSAGPIETAHSTSRIFLRFNEDMVQDTVETRLRTEPAIEGAITWNGRMVILTPTRALIPGQEYTVILERGATSTSGRLVLAEYRFVFRVGTPRVAYLYPADGRTHNIYIADPADPAVVQQITFSPSGIYDYAVSPDGEHIAFTENDPVSQVSEIKILNIITGELRQVTNCAQEDAFCTTPVWRPDGQVIAYERRNINSDLNAVGVSPTRIYLIDLSSTPPAHRPLFQDSQILGYGVRWSASGGQIALYNSTTVSILIFDFATGTLSEIPSSNGTTGALSPDGTRLVFPEVLLEENGSRQYLRLADLENNTLENLSDPAEPLHDTTAAWHPDNQYLAVVRQYRDERFTRRGQIYLLDAQRDSDTYGEVTPLVQDPRYAHSALAWDPSGTQLLFQRFQELNDDGTPNMVGRPEIWTVELATQTPIQIVQNAYLAQWVP